jgi:plastocyanin
MSVVSVPVPAHNGKCNGTHDGPSINRSSSAGTTGRKDRTMSLPRSLAPALLAVTLAGSLIPLAAGVSLAAAPRRAQVAIQNFAFAPLTLKVTAGTTVVWTNRDSVAHTVTATHGRWSSGTLNQGQTYAYTFKKPGTYTYHCAFHPSMVAKVIVAAPGHKTQAAVVPPSGY